MSFIKNLNFRRFATAAAVSGILLFGNAVDAAVTDDAGMKAFREAYTEPLSATRMFRQDFILVSTTFHLELKSNAQITPEGSMKMSGDLLWTYTNLQKNYSTNSALPFYIEQSGNNLMLYIQRGGQWSKMALPGLPSGIITLWKSNDMNVVNQNMDAVKKVEVLKDTSDVRIMKVTLDGDKIAKLIEKNSQASFANLSGDALAEEKENLNRWLTAIKTSDVTFTWGVKKPNWTTVSITFELTDIMRAYSRYVLSESAAGRIVLTDEERDLLDVMGYYSELHSYTTYLSPDSGDIKFNIPPNLESIPENDSSLDDIFAEMTTAVVKK